MSRPYAPGHWQVRGLRMPKALRTPAPAPEPLVIPSRLRMDPLREAARSDGVDWGPSPADFFGTLSVDSGERRLMLAVLTDGISAVLAPRGRHSSQAHREALRWLEAMSGAPFGFKWLCSALGIETPEKIARTVLARAGVTTSRAATEPERGDASGPSGNCNADAPRRR